MGISTESTCKFLWIPAHFCMQLMHKVEASQPVIGSQVSPTFDRTWAQIARLITGGQLELPTLMAMKSLLSRSEIESEYKRIK